MVWLDREVHVERGVRFVGCTLWADFDLLVDAWQDDKVRKQMIGLGVFDGLGDWKVSEETYREQAPLILGILKELDIQPE